MVKQQLLYSILLPVLASLGWGCTSSKTAEPESPGYEVLVAEMYGDDATCEPNEAGTFMLCKSPFRAMDQLPGYQFFTFDVASGKVTFESKANCTDVKWMDDFHVQVEQISGVARQDQGTQDGSKTLDVRTGVFQ